MEHCHEHFVSYIVVIVLHIASLYLTKYMDLIRNVRCNFYISYIFTDLRKLTRLYSLTRWACRSRRHLLAVALQINGRNALQVVQAERIDATLVLGNALFGQPLRLVIVVVALEHFAHDIFQRFRPLDDQRQAAARAQRRLVGAERLLVDQRPSDAQDLLVGDRNVQQSLHLLFQLVDGRCFGHLRMQRDDNN